MPNAHSDALVEITIVFIIGIFVLFYSPLLYKMVKNKNARLQFFRGTLKILKRTESSDEEAVILITNLYKKLLERFPHLSLTYRSQVDFLEDFLARSDGLKLFKYGYGFLTVTDEQKTRISKIIQKMKEQEPFSSVSGKFRILLNGLKSALNNIQHPQPSIMSIEQLYQDIEMLENALHSEQHRYANSAKLSIVGIALTIAFGLISLITVFVGQK